MALELKDKMYLGAVIRSDCRSQNLGLRHLDVSGQTLVGPYGCSVVTASVFFPLSHILPLSSLFPPLALSRRSFPKTPERGGGARDGEDALVIRAVTQVNSIILFSFAA